MIDYTDYWIFLNNPKYWDLETFLKDSKEKNIPLTWTIGRGQEKFFFPNQYGILRIGKDKRTTKELKYNKRLESGIYAIVQITSFPKKRSEEEYHIWNNTHNLNNDNSFLNQKYYVDLKILHNLIDRPLLFKDISNIPEIDDDRFLISGFQSATIPLSEKCFNKLLDLCKIENQQLEKINNELILTGLEKELITKYRIGQTNFRTTLLSHEKKCKICGLSNESFLIASHIKPWSVSDKFEKVDTNNGFLLCPHHDKLFDGGYISFQDDGEIIISSLINKNDQSLMNINSKIKIKLNNNNLKYLKYHRENILKK